MTELVAGDRVQSAAPTRQPQPAPRLEPDVGPHMDLLDLQRRVGNSAVSQMLIRRQGTTGRSAVVQRQPRSAAPTASDLSLQFQQRLGGAAPDYNAAALTLNGMSDADMEVELRALNPAVQSLLFLGALRTMLMWPPPHRVTDIIHRLNLTASRDGLITYFRESVTYSHWHEAAVALNGLSDPDIATTIALPPLSTAQLVQIRDAARQNMAGWNTRVVTPIGALLQGASANELDGLVGSRATWIGSGPGSGNTFERWASAPTQGTTPPVQPSTRINCWEMVLLAAFRAGTINWQWIHDAYTATGVGHWAAFLANKLTPAGRQTYSRRNPGPTPRRGDIVLWNGISHVAMAVGGRDGAGRTKVYSFWPPPGTAFVRGGTADAVKITTIEELADYMDDNGMSAGVTLVEFGPGPW